MSAHAVPRLLWIADRYPPLTGGMAVSCHRQTSGLRRRGVRLDVLAIVGEWPEVHLHETARDGGSDFCISREAPPGPVAQRLWRHAQQQHAAEPYSWIVGFGANRPGFMASTFAAWLGVPSLVMVRGNDFDQDWFDPRSGFVVREALGRAAVIGAVAPETCRRIAALMPGADVRFVPNGVDASQWELLPGEQRRSGELRAELAADGRRVIGLFGELKYKKQIAAWLAALRAARQNDRVTLLTVGTLDEPTRQVLADPALSPPWKHIPFTAREELPALYAACDFVAVPSLYEGMPNVLLEAMASGVVPIVSSAGAMDAVVRDGETGLVFPPGDHHRMAEAIGRAVSLDAAAREAMSARARRFVQEHFSVDKELDAIGSIVTSWTFPVF